MKHVSEFRHPQRVSRLVEQLHTEVTRPWRIMEICGGQTHSIYRHGLQQLIPDEVTLLHGPGCPVCVTPARKIDLAVELSLRPHTVVCSFGDMLRVPGSKESLLGAKARGGRVQLVTSPLGALDIARQNPTAEIVFLGIGFETTAPANAMAAFLAHKEGLSNFSLLLSQVTVPPAIRFLLSQPDTSIQGFLAAGHVCAITGYEAYHELAEGFGTPIAVTGFEPVDILLGLVDCIRLLERGMARVTNSYQRAVTESGNRAAQDRLAEVFELTDQEWRGIGMIPNSGLTFRGPYKGYDAEERFEMAEGDEVEQTCLAGAVMQGKIKPEACPHFGKDCVPSAPLGAPMVSSEGACAAAFRYQSVVKKNPEAIHGHL